ncbi:alpha/beta hydrolase [Pseudonocardia sp. McavD-2-B]|uniref:alpha/beta hydrolase n=1 Tax=Pseudonocardia sp. McavD-2-B TaxID=2954499 RepID=UPI002096A44F|nr:alpha/beta hydrolase [Pseudonocardia sp. McavD-2-B]MCO7191941.1 alpha/beta hydrolase [Pseudonocardia sp. McavD-2-B]
MFRSHLLRLAVGVVSLTAVAACGAPAPPGAAAAAATTPPPQLAAFHDQQITWQPCDGFATSAADRALYANDRFDCARVQVPLDYADPDGPRGQVALLRAKARGEKIGSLLVDPGGPGGSGASFVASLGPVWDNVPVGERFDVIGFDPRGVGASTPRVDCFTDAETDRNALPSTYLFDVADTDRARDIARRCTDATGGVEALTSVGSDNVVQDMDVLRAALGEEKLTYLGYSYGSELGAMYAQTFPQNLRAMVVDGAVDPDISEAQLRLSQFEAWQKAFDDLAATCATEPDCPLGTDPARATEVFQDLTRPLLDHPAPTTDGRTLTYTDMVPAVYSSLFSPAQRPQLLQGLRDLAAGRGDTLLALRDAALGRGPDGHYGGSTHIDANLAVRCMDNPRRTPAEQAELRDRARRAAPFLDPGRPGGPTHYECEGWPEPPSRTLPWSTDTAGLPPTLTLSLTDDPGTPYQGGVHLARALGGSLLTVEAAQHGIALYGGNACVDRAVTDYLVDLVTPPPGARCGG